jgi:hypothetical protein
MFVVMALEMVFMILGSLVISAFSRYREYRADEGGAKLAGRENMISALQGLQKMFEPIEEGTSLQTMKISPNKFKELDKFRTIGECIAFAFEEVVEEKLIQPTIIYDYPVENSPLAKKCADRLDFAGELVELESYKGPDGSLGALELQQQSHSVDFRELA